MGLSAFINTVCTQAGQYIYTVDNNGMFARFDPTTLSSLDIAPLNCPTTASPFSMNVDQQGFAWIVFDDGKLFRLDTATADAEEVSEASSPPRSTTAQGESRQINESRLSNLRDHPFGRFGHCAFDAPCSLSARLAPPLERPMVTRLTNQRVTAPSARPAENLPKVAVQSNDMSQRTAKTGPNSFSITGTASNRGFAPSSVSLKVNGKSITVPQGGGETPAKVAKKISDALPKGFKAEVTPGSGNSVNVTITAAKAGGVGGGGRLMSPTAFAQQNLANGTEITKLVAGGRGWSTGKDILKNPTELAKHKVGEFDGGRGRGGPLKNEVFQIKVAGPDDRPIDRIIVRVPVLQPNDAIKYKFIDVGTMAQGGPNL